MSFNEDITRFREKLNETTEWPSSYMFKFVVPNQDGKVDKVKDILSPYGIITFKNTKNLKFVSITCISQMPDADQIIDITVQITSIEGVMAL